MVKMAIDKMRKPVSGKVAFSFSGMGEKPIGEEEKISKTDISDDLKNYLDDLIRGALTTYGDTTSEDMVINIIRNYITYITNIFNTGGDGPGVQQAVTTAAAGAATTIAADVYDDEGVPSELKATVYCSIMGGGNLNVAIPRLSSGDTIYVVSINNAWYCVSLFQTIDEDEFSIVSGELKTALDECPLG